MEVIFYILIMLFFTFFFLMKKKEAVLWIPLFTVLVDVLPLYITGGMNYESKFYIIFSYYRALVFISIFIYSLSKYKIERNILFPILSYSIYILFRQAFTDSFYENIKLSITLISYISVIYSSFILFRYNSISIKKTLNVNKIVFLLFLLNAIYCTYNGFFSKEGYSGTIIAMGAFSLMNLYGIIYLILFYLCYIKYLNFKDLLLLSLAFVIVILNAKRTPIILFLVGLFVYIFYNRKYIILALKKSKNIIILLVSCVLLIVSYSVYQYMTENVRKKASTLEYKQEGRFMEYIQIAHEFSKNPHYILVGKNNGYKSGFDKFDNVTQMEIEGRSLHSDISIMLVGTGFIGLFLYFYIFLSLSKINIKIGRSYFNHKYHVMFWMMLLPLLANSLADSHTVATARVIVYMIMGLSIGIQAKQNNILKYEYINSKKRSLRSRTDGVPNTTDIK